MREGPDLDSKITSTSRFAPVGAREDREAEASGGRSQEIARAAGVIRSSAFEAAEDLREVVGVLRKDDDTVDPERPQPTPTDLPQLIDQSRRAGMPVTIENRLADLGAVPAGIGRHAYRIIQEGLTNARKHAPGAPVRVTVAGGPGTLLAAVAAMTAPVGMLLVDDAPLVRAGRSILPAVVSPVRP
jgi:hypothetical protein